MPPAPLCHLDRTGFVGAGRDDAAIQGVDEIGNFRRGAGGDFPYGGQGVPA